MQPLRGRLPQQATAALHLHTPARARGPLPPANPPRLGALRTDSEALGRGLEPELVGAALALASARARAGIRSTAPAGAAARALLLSSSSSLPSSSSSTCPSPYPSLSARRAYHRSSTLPPSPPSPQATKEKKPPTSLLPSPSMPPPPSAPTPHREIVAALPESFARARASGDLLFFPSTVHVHSEGGVDVSRPPSVPACCAHPAPARIATYG